MKFGLFTAFASPFATGEMITRTGEVAEAAGIDSIWLGEHVVLFREYESKYPYSDDGRIPAPPGSGITEPFTTMGLLAGCTSTVRLGTGICLLPQRNPVYTAKEVATLDYLSGGRIDLGIGIGWLKEEFDACNVDWANRGRRTDEYVDVLKTCWMDEESSFEGEFWTLPPCEMYPKPAQDPHPPIIVGGESDAAMRRVARLGDGWIGFNHTPDTAAESVARLTKIMAEAGRSIDEVEVTVCPYFNEVGADDMERFAEAGVDQVIVTFFAGSADDVEATMEGLSPLRQRAQAG